MSNVLTHRLAKVVMLHLSWKIIIGLVSLGGGGLLPKFLEMVTMGEIGRHALEVALANARTLLLMHLWQDSLLLFAQCQPKPITLDFVLVQVWVFGLTHNNSLLNISMCDSNTYIIGINITHITFYFMNTRPSVFKNTVTLCDRLILALLLTK